MKKSNNLLPTLVFVAVFSLGAQFSIIYRNISSSFYMNSDHVDNSTSVSSFVDIKQQNEETLAEFYGMIYYNTPESVGQGQGQGQGQLQGQKNEVQVPSLVLTTENSNVNFNDTINHEDKLKEAAEQDVSTNDDAHEAHSDNKGVDTKLSNEIQSEVLSPTAVSATNDERQ